MGSGSEAGSYVRLMDFVYHSTLGSRVIKKKRGDSPAMADWTQRSSSVTSLILSRERELFIDNLLVRIHLIIEMISVDRPCSMKV